MPGEEMERVPRSGESPSLEPVSEARIDGGDWGLRIEDDGWYLCEEGAGRRRVSVGEAVERVGNRAAVFRVTRMFVAAIGRELAVAAWIKPTAPGHEDLRARGLDPKLPSEQIALAGDVIARLGAELAAAEATRPG
jgi:hypothetical protein